MVPEPVAAFTLLGERLAQDGKLPPGMTPEVFAQLRKAAEVRARDESSRTRDTLEARLLEIYQELARALPLAGPPEELAAAEVELERDICRADRARAVRAGLPGRGLGARPRGAERPGLQPLHRHAASASPTAPTRCAASTSTTMPTSRPTATWATRRRGASSNPDVTVRARGVMEKCTYCVQRISRRPPHRREGGPRRSRDGEVVTACQSRLPDPGHPLRRHVQPGAAIAALREDPRHYALLGELGTRPRTTYLARLRNPNPALEEPRHERHRAPARVPLDRAPGRQLRGGQRAGLRAADRRRLAAGRWRGWWITLRRRPPLRRSCSWSASLVG